MLTLPSPNPRCHEALQEAFRSGESKETGKAVTCPQKGSLRPGQRLGGQWTVEGWLGAQHREEKSKGGFTMEALGGQAQQGGCMLLTWLEQDDSVSRRHRK